MMADALRLLVALTVVTSAIIAMLLLARRPARHAFGASIAYRAWLLVPLSMVAVLLPGAPQAGAEFVGHMQIEPVYLLVERSLGSPIDTPMSVDWVAWSLGVWLVGVVAFLVYFAGAQWAYVKSLGKLSEASGTLRAETSTGCPALLGVLSPKIVLPRDFESRYTAQERALVLAHEGVHLERRDMMWNALVVLLRCVFWFNPLVHIAAGRMRMDQELACDAAVIDRHPTSRRTYADAMLKTELADAALPVGCHWQASHPFKERLEMLKTTSPTRARRVLGSALLAATSVVVTYAAWAAEPAVEPAPIASTTVTQTKAPVTVAHLTKGTLKLGPREGKFLMTATVGSIHKLPNGATVVDNYGRIEFIPPAGADRVLDVPRPVQPRPISVSARTMTLTPTDDGGILVEFEDGVVEEY